MNVSTGSTHILLFERDQQLTALLMSEFQLAGYECHAARTAVEVFDGIARYPVRLVLVNLAQAAAARREFWVALDTQRRGRGVQVLNFVCSNLASYSSREGDERSYSMAIDLHIDGMLGLMSLVQAVRSRLAGVSSTTNTHPRLPRANSESTPTMTTSPTTPFASPHMLNERPSSPSVPSAAHTTSGNAYSNNRTDTQPVARAYSSSAAQPQQVARSGEVGTTTPASPSTTINSTPQQSYTDKIRAVLYPNQRPSVAQPVHDVQGVPTTSHTTNTITTNTSMLQQLANGQTYSGPSEPTPATPYESGLDQLSRMVQERHTTSTNGYGNGNAYATPAVTDTRLTSEATPSSANTPSVQNGSLNTSQYATTTTHRPNATPVEEPVNIQTLRASPIQDLPLETYNDYDSREEGYMSGTSTSSMQQGYAQAPVTPLASMTAPLPKAAIAPTASPTAPAQAQARPTVPMPAVQEATTIAAKQAAEPAPATATPVQTMPQQETAEESTEDNVPTGPLHAQEDSAIENGTEEPIEQPQTMVQEIHIHQSTPASNAAANNAVLLDIMQSLPPMPAPLQQPQPQALQGRASRTLGSVLLEGHLVPQSRLEVAQNIQRMLRGVDLNYQLGEILLMFKLLTPDQLLAASLVSYGLLTTQQIVALGRIRQELHSIGLEYDLEALLILFRILTPEQLREVRSSWQS